MNKYQIISILKDLIQSEKESITNSIMNGHISEEEVPKYVMKYQTFNECLELIKRAVDEETKQQNMDEVD